MKKIIIGLLLMTVLLSGCSANSTKQNKTIDATVTKIGVVTTKVGNEYLLNTDEGIVNITSTKINFDNYLKKPIRVTGMYSGSTLYVDEIQSP